MSRRTLYKFRLYVAADTLNSTQALANLNALCRTHLPGRHEIEIVDVFREPQRALDEGIRMMTRIVECKPEEVCFGMKVEVVFHERDGFHLPYFRPIKR